MDRIFYLSIVPKKINHKHSHKKTHARNEVHDKIRPGFSIFQILTRIGLIHENFYRYFYY
jgi:hypothetical protein